MKMKKAVIVLLVLALPAILWARDIDQGRVELSGQTSFEFSDSSTEVTGSPDTDTTTYEFRFDGLYYVLKNLGLGLFVTYENTEEEQAGASSDFSMYVIGPQVTYNIPLNENVSFFVNGAVGFANLEADDEEADGFGYQVGGGLKYFLANSASINGTIRYQSLNLEDDLDRDIDQSGVGFGIGVSIYF